MGLIGFKRINSILKILKDHLSGFKQIIDPNSDKIYI